MKVHVIPGGGGLRLHVREWGQADGPPILFLHGWSQNHLCWARQYDSALAGEFRLIACDLRGHGMSEHILATCPTAQASWYDGVGHVPHLEEPERFNRELAELTGRTRA
jgi:non-heme chloroperoxidase